MDKEHGVQIGRLLKQHRLSLELTLKGIAEKSGVCASHIGRIERGERFPSAKVLGRMAEPLGFEGEELMRLAGYLTVKPHDVKLRARKDGLDPFVAQTLAAKPVEIQRLTLSLLVVIEAAAKNHGE